MSELERNLEETRKELGRTRGHSAQSEEQWHAREQDLLVHLEDSRAREKRLEDQKHNLEVCLVDATQQIQELKVIKNQTHNIQMFIKKSLLGKTWRCGRKN